MALTMVTCPECSREFEIRDRARCQCGAYLIHGLPAGSAMVKPTGNIYRWLPGPGDWQKIWDKEEYYANRKSS